MTWHALRPPCSFAQRSMWLVEKLAPGTPVYMTSVALTIEGRLDVGALRRALDAVVARHEVLRTTYEPADGEPVQIVASELPAELEEVDLRRHPADVREIEVRRLVREIVEKPVDLSVGPVQRSTIFRLEDDAYVFFVATHHIAFDGHSARVFFRDLRAFYESFVTGRPPSLPGLGPRYADFAIWQHRQWEDGAMDRSLAFWRERLGGHSGTLDLPFDRPRPTVRDFRSDVAHLDVSPQLSAALGALARSEGVSLFDVAYAAFATLIHRYTGNDDLVIGLPVTGRDYPGTRNLVGLFVNTLPLRTPVSGGVPFRGLLRLAREIGREALAHEDLPFAKLVEELRPRRSPGVSPVYQVTLNWHSFDRQHFDVAGLRSGPFRLGQPVSELDLGLHGGKKGGRISFALEFSPELFRDDTARRMLGHLETLLGAAAADPDRRISALPLLADEERRRMLAASSGARAELPAGVCIHELVAAQAARTPDAVAVISGETEISYRELWEKAVRLARVLRRRGVGPETLVGLCVERSIELVVGILGILEAGGAYVPLDPEAPAHLLAVMLADAGASFVLVAGSTDRALPTSFEGEAIAIEEAVNRADAHDPPEVAASARVRPENLAYVMYTSGSTGPPKGVAVAHVSVCNHIFWMRRDFEFGASDRVLHCTPLGFDPSVWELFAPLVTGASVVMASPGAHADPASVVDAISTHGITVLQIVPSLLRAMLDEPGIEACASLRAVFCGGEAMTVALRTRFRSTLRAMLVNVYGPTEATIDATAWVCGDDACDDTVPIGRPISNVRAYVLDGNLEPVPIGVCGDLYVGGTSLARGYHAAPGLTAERFVPDPFGDTGGRLYRTGDLARFRPDGAIDFLGRADEQVKINGARVEPGSIEADLSLHPAVRGVAVVARHIDRGKQLVAYVVPEAGAALSPAELREYLRARRLRHEVPSVFVFVAALPLTSSGKVNRRGLPAPEESGAGRVLAEPRTEAEAALAAIWSEVLGLDEVGVEEDFFALGGHSLLATRVISRIRATLGVELPLRAIFDSPTVAGLAARLRSARAAAGSRIEPRFADGGSVRPLSFAQERLWFLDRLTPGSAAYNVPFALRLTGPLDADALERALREIQRRHEPLRARFATVDARPQQVVVAEPTLRLSLVDLRALDERTTRARAVVAADAFAPFDLETGPLCRATLVRLEERSHVLLVVTHHIATDGWSLAVLLRELGALYTAYTAGRESPLQELEICYGDYAAWQREWLTGDELEGQIAYWTTRLAGAETLALPTDRPRHSVSRHHGGAYRLAVSAGLRRGVEALARSEGATPFMVLLAAFQALLHRYTGQTDVVVGTPVANRNRGEVEDLIGVFVNSLVLRGDLSGAPTFVELVRRVREATLEDFARQDLPFERLVEELNVARDLSRNPLFQVMFALENAPVEPLALDGVDSEPFDIGEATTRVDVHVNLWERDGGYEGEIYYDVDLFDEETVARLGWHFVTLLEGGVAIPETRIERLPLLAASERRTVLEDWNATERDWPGDATIASMFEAQVARTPDAVALEHEGERQTFRTVNRLANRLAIRLRALGVGPEARVGIHMRRSMDTIVALLGIAKAGGAYVPLDPLNPRERLDYMIADSGARVVVRASCDEGLDAEAPLDATEVFLDREPPGPGYDANPVSGAAAANLAYVIYTSGSTGRPKGVLVEHRSLLNYVRAIVERYALAPGASYAMVQPLAFDSCASVLYPPLFIGGTLHLVSEERATDPVAFGEYVDRHTIDCIKITPSHLAALQLAPDPRAVLPRRLLLLGGESSRVEWAERLLAAKQPTCAVFNHYGPTEATVGMLTHAMEPPMPATRSGSVPLGRPFANARVYVLDGGLEPVPIGVFGEIYIGGACVARGYLGVPGLTAERFVPDPFHGAGTRMYRTGDTARYLRDGSVEFLGRADDQVKVRGFRIELGEIESTLVEHASVREAVVVARSERIAAYVVPVEGLAVRPADLRDFLAARLPAYMVPSAFRVLDALPRTTHGKLDRGALPAPDWSELACEDAYLPPRDPVEEAIAGIWAEVLGVARVGVQDDFFALGGHSLLATQAISRIRAIFAAELPLRAMFEAPTVVGLAERVRQAQRAELGVSLAPIPVAARGAERTLSYSQQRLWFLDQLGEGNVSYTIPLALRLIGALDVEALAESLRRIVARHEALRTSFVSVEGVPVERVADDVRLEVPVVDLTHLPGAEREVAVRLLANHEEEEPLDMMRAPLLRARVLRLGAEEHVLLVTTHHIVSDGWSMSVLMRELPAFYEALRGGSPALLPELPIQYSDYAAWQREWLRTPALERQVSYWKRQLEGIAPLDLPTDRPRPPVQTTRGATHYFAVDRDATECLRALGRSEGATLFMAVMAVFAMVLGRWSGRKDVVVGTPVANRTRAETEGLIGIFVNALAMRVDLGGDPTFRELVRRVREVAVGAYAHQEVPFEYVLDALRPERDPSRTPVFQVWLNFLNIPRARIELGDLAIEPLSRAPEGRVLFDVTLYAIENDGGIDFHARYNTDLFDHGTIVALFDQFDHLLKQVALQPDERTSRFSLVTPRAATVLPDPMLPLSDAWEGAIHDLFARHARRAPDRVAVVDAGGTWTYGDLERRSNWLASRLRAQGVEKGDVVAIHAARSASLVWALLGILKAGAAFLVLDPAYPPSRVIACLRLARPRAWMEVEGAGPVAPETVAFLDEQDLACRMRLPSLDPDDAADLAAGGGVAPEVEIGPDDLAYIAFTSGSTGEPKGILGRHGPLTHFVPWIAERFELGEADRFSMASGLAHDPLHRDVFTPLQLGATVCVPDPDDFAPGRLALWMRETGVTVAHLTPALAGVLSGAAEGDRATALRRVFFVGDKLKAGDVARVRAIAPGARCVNLYGTTETQRAVGFFEVGDEARGRETLPAGRGMKDVQLLVLGESERLAGIGELGEIYVRSPHLARGYLSEDATRERFLANPTTGDPRDRVYRTGDLGRYAADGEVEIEGRIDGQVKVRGYRVEPGEVEAALAAHADVREALVIVREDRGEGAQLVAYVVARGSQTPGAATLRTFLRRKLPEYMVPSVFVEIDRIPMTPNGKVDRRRLPEPFQGDVAARVAPGDDVERRLLEIWEDVLKRKGIGVRDDFFDLGGHSLLAVRVFARIERRFGRKLPLASLFQAPTVERLAELLRSGEGSALWGGSLVPIRPGGSRVPLFIVHGIGGDVLVFRDLASYLDSDQPVYGLRAHGQDGRTPRDERLEDMAARYVAEIRAVCPEGPYVLAGQSFGGWVAFEMAQQLRRAGEEVAALVLFDTYGPGYRRSASTSRRLAEHVRHLRSLEGHERVDYLAVRMRAVRTFLTRQAWRLAHDVLRRAGRRMPAGLGNLEGAHYLRALLDYEPRPYAERVILFRAAEQPVGAYPHRHLGWESLAAGVEVYDVPGGHASLITEPHVRTLAARLSDVLGDIPRAGARRAS